MDTLEQIEQYAKENYVPIARKQTVQFLVNLIKENHFKSFLEIGTAIGYTSLILATTFQDLSILTIEHNEKRAKLAKELFLKFNVDKKIDFNVCDAVSFETEKHFDLIFIDAAKKKNSLFLDKFSKNLNEDGIIIVDNMNMDDFNQMAKEKKQIYYEKVNNEFKNYVFNSNKYDATLFDDIGDGIMVIKLINK